MEDNRILDKLDRIDARITAQGEALARLEERLKGYDRDLKEHKEDDEKLQKKMDDMVKFKWTALGALSVITVAGQIFIKMVMK